MRPLKITLTVIGTFQLVLGLVFLIAPARAAAALGLTPVAPGWANCALFVGALLLFHPRRHSTVDDIASSFHDAASLDTAR